MNHPGGPPPGGLVGGFPPPGGSPGGFPGGIFGGFPASGGFPWPGGGPFPAPAPSAAAGKSATRPWYNPRSTSVAGTPWAIA
ncbi:hypothetical protein CRI94_09415 [Longibacter salinarum]|uniref:Uncharacterized protein n=1 Tax=Longibacter salinarum TaxID=1850348 RepID=A0A2A8CXS3_9BACT|nr:hypothetical protein CRI94_09415 [Longibacter salinarum]